MHVKRIIASSIRHCFSHCISLQEAIGTVTSNLCSYESKMCSGFQPTFGACAPRLVVEIAQFLAPPDMALYFTHHRYKTHPQGLGIFTMIHHLIQPGSDQKLWKIIECQIQKHNPIVYLYLSFLIVLIVAEILRYILQSFI